jgi:hypothetical protein
MLNDESPDRHDIPPPPPRKRPPKPRFVTPAAASVVAPSAVADAPPPAAPSEPPPSDPPRSGPRVSRPVLLGLGVVVILAGCLALGIVLRGATDDTPSQQPVAAAAVTEAPPSDTGQPAADHSATRTQDATVPDDGPDTSTDTQAPAPVASPAAQRRDTRRLNISRAIRVHWKQRLAGDTTSLAEAYRAYVGPIRNRAGTEARWTAGIREDGLQVMTIGHLLVSRVTSSSGKAVAWVHTESDEGGCADWTMHYVLHKVAGRWRIWNSTADKSSC